ELAVEPGDFERKIARRGAGAASGVERREGVSDAILRELQARFEILLPRAHAVERGAVWHRRRHQPGDLRRLVEKQQDLAAIETERPCPFGPGWGQREAALGEHARLGELAAAHGGLRRVER